MNSEIIEIKRISKFEKTIEAPPSKAHTLRALFISSLAEGNSKIKNPLYAEDQILALDCLKKLGTSIEYKEDYFSVCGNYGNPKESKEKLFVGNSGVTARFLCSYCALAEGKNIIDGNERMRQRPIGKLINALRFLGVKVKYLNQENYLPIEIEGKSLIGGKTEIEAEESSQYISSILISAPYSNQDVEIKVKGEIVSEPYIKITTECMSDFGVLAEELKHSYFVISGQKYKPKVYCVEGDYSNSSYFFAAAAITKSTIRIKNLKKNSHQPDAEFISILERMGCRVNYKDDLIILKGDELSGCEVNMKNCPDIVPTLAIVAAFAKGETKIRGIKHLRLKESDRIEAIISNLKRIGINASFSEDCLKIEGNPKKIRGATIEPYDDHRIAMAFSIVGLVVDGIKIRNHNCVKKSFPNFYEKLRELEE